MATGTAQRIAMSSTPSSGFGCGGSERAVTKEPWWSDTKLGTERVGITGMVLKAFIWACVAHFEHVLC